MDTSIRAPVDTFDAQGRPTEQYWINRLDEIARSYVYRPLNEIVRMRFRQELKALEAEADDVGELERFSFARDKWFAHVNRARK